MTDLTHQQLLRVRREHLARIGEIKHALQRMTPWERGQYLTDLEEELAFEQGSIEQIDRELQARRRSDAR